MRPHVLRPVTPDDPGPPGLDISHAIVAHDAVRASGTRSPLAWVSGLNALVPPAGLWEAMMRLNGVPLVLRTGWPPGPDASPAWMPGSRTAFEAVAQRLGQELERADGSVWWWPCAAHVLSDVPSVLAFFRTHATPRFGLLLDGVSMLTPGMVERAEEHLARMFEALGGHPAVRGVLLGNVPPAGGIEGLALSGLTRGVVRPDAVRALWRCCCPGDVPVVLLEPGLDEQLALLARD